MAALAELVSCILPVFNGERFLAGAIESILGQERPLDVIVVDDGSTDRSAAIAAGFAGIRVLSQANSGLAAARNAGLAAARGDFIAFLDADDLWLPGKLSRQRELLRSCPTVDLCFGLVLDITLAGSEGDFVDAAPRPGRMAQSMLARRRAFERLGGFDTARRMRADQDWLVRAREHGLVEHMLDEVLLHRRIHGANRSITHDHLLAGEFLAIAYGARERRRQRGQVSVPVERWTANGDEAKP